MQIDEIKRLLDELGAAPKKSLGQNFLISEGVIGKIVDEVSRCAPRALVEIGPGLGALTRRLSRLSVPFRLIELDQKFAGYWREQGLDVLEADAMRVDWAALNLEQALLVSNLPYQISSSIVIDRSIEPHGVESMILMFQKEVAQRIAARPGSKDYGLLSVIAQNYWKIRALLDAGPRDFYPPPNVASRVLVFQRACADPLLEENGPLFLNFVKAAFSQRRKLLWKNLLQAFRPLKVSPDELKQAVVELGLTENARAENLSPRDFLRLFQAVARV